MSHPDVLLPIRLLPHWRRHHERSTWTWNRIVLALDCARAGLSQAEAGARLGVSKHLVATILSREGLGGTWAHYRPQRAARRQP